VIKTVKDLSAKGFLDKEIGKIIGKSNVDVSRIRHKYIGKKKKIEVTTKVLETIKKLNAKGLTDKEIGDVVGETQVVISRIRYKYGIKRGNHDKET